MGLVVEGLSCNRSGRPVLDGIRLELPDGACLSLRGPNGAGKSTLLRILAGLLPASAGTIALDGIRLDHDRDGYGERLAYAGHLDAIKPQLSVAENLAFWAALYAGGAIAPALATFDLTGIAERPAHVCSAGQKRRLGLARLLVAPRRLWLLDEPTVSLDADAVTRLLAVLRDHLAQGGMAVVATHVDLELPDSRELRLAPPAARTETRHTDPFLAGDWA
jgi:heme exporter protein A